MPALGVAPRPAQTNFTSVPVPLSGARVKSSSYRSPVIWILAVKLAVVEGERAARAR